MLSLALSVSSATMKPGGSVTATVRVASANATAQNAVVRIAASGASVSPGTQSIGAVGSGGAAAIATVRAPSGAKPGLITVRATASASKASSVSRSYKLIITDASGAPPPGVSLANLPPGVPPLTPSTFNPLAGMKGPQVALPPISSPQIAASPAPIVPVAGLRTIEDETLTVQRLSSLQAGFLAAMAVSVALLLLRVRLSRRVPAVRIPLPRAQRRRLRSAGKRLTEARVRALPPQPARSPVRIVWLPVRPARVARL
ncbi:hypothetical protein [Actinomadura livida]|uniref:Uncharacterized protein n=1 Tax=Actinomadura livida TaxID=79909 RepID=A0A7W7II34_9ACTN|nr:MULTISPECIES: hypothetical protein [Actinomadura]MBB4777508.1 hypothetical protein [Actinomadura catellatispora]